MTDGPLDRFWSLPTQALLDRLSTSPAGLSRMEAEERLARYGPNTVAEPPRLDIARKIGRRFADHWSRSCWSLQRSRERRGSSAAWHNRYCDRFLDRARPVSGASGRARRRGIERSVAVRADVRRDGAVTAIPVDQLVAGDVVELRAGDLVPADGIVLESRNAHANEALMTGEPYPADKYPGPCNANTPPEAFNALFAGDFDRQRRGDHAGGGHRQGHALWRIAVALDRGSRRPRSSAASTALA